MAKIKVKIKKSKDPEKKKTLPDVTVKGSRSKEDNKTYGATEKGGVRSAPKKMINETINPNDIVKPGYGENGRKLRTNYTKEQIRLAQDGKSKSKK